MEDRPPAGTAAVKNSPVAETVRGYKIASQGLLAVMGVLPNTICASEAFFRLCQFRPEP